MKRIVIFAPHPDDEILGCTSIIKNAAKRELYIILVTNGDYLGKKTARTRIKESQRALSLLDVPQHNIIVLGYGDTGMAVEESFLCRLFHCDADTILTSKTSCCTYHPIKGAREWHYQITQQHAHYTRRAFLYDLTTVLQHCLPDEIYVSSQYDKHGDHCALYWFLLEAIEQLNRSIAVKQYIIHGGNDKLWPERGADFFSKPPCCAEHLWRSRIISNGLDQAEKSKLIQAFKSQISPSGYLLSFAKKTEFFLEE